jgi:hypothetical protein
VTSDTATLRVGRLQCTDPDVSFDYRYEAPSAESLSETLELSLSAGLDATGMVKAQIRGKWLGAECGDATPLHR